MYEQRSPPTQITQWSKKFQIILMRSVIIKKASQDEQKIKQQQQQTLITSKTLCPFKKETY